MVGLINLGSGIAAMGQSLAESSLLGEKDALENQKMVLANSLATQRQSAGITEQGAVTAGLQSSQQEFEKGQQGRQQTFEQGMQKGQQKFEAGEQTEKLTSEQKIAQDEIRANAGNIQTQISAAHTNIQYTPNGPVILNDLTGKQEPLLDAKGQPMQLINTALVPIARATVDSNNEQMRAENQTYSSQLNSLNQQMKEAADSVTAVTPQAKAEAMRPYQARIAALNNQHSDVMQSLRDSSSHATAALFTQGANPQDARGAPPPQGNAGGNKPAPKNRPPLDSFYHSPTQP